MIARKEMIVAVTVAGIAAATGIADAVDAGDVLDGVVAEVAVAAATGIVGLTDRAAAAICPHRSMLLPRVIVTIAAGSTTVALRTIAGLIVGPSLPPKNARTTLFCRANRSRSIARGPCLRQSNRLEITNPKSVNQIMSRPHRVPRSACNLEREPLGGSLAACRTGF
jgi:hypothetical protein